ncbi:MAG: zinc ribbon domain-containing protein [Candidatus Makaraimicrobium thalassicum]|nr:MAG: zinc ribbon domain-containing protein [Candidatus Omnitrophota bacterium]
MPTYEYKCRSCGYHFEQFQSMTDSPVKNCPECNGPVKRLIGTGAGIIFKGSGFYQTDYKNSGSEPKGKPDSAGKPAACGNSDSCPCCDQNV